MIAASLSVFPASGDNIISLPVTLEKLSNCLSNACSNIETLTFNFFKMNGITFSSTSKMPLKICSFSIC